MYLQCLIVGITIIARNSYNISDCKQKDRELRLNQHIRFLYEFYYEAAASWVGRRPSCRQPPWLVSVIGSHIGPPLAGQRSSRRPLELRSHGAAAAWVGRQTNWWTHWSITQTKQPVTDRAMGCARPILTCAPPTRAPVCPAPTHAPKRA
jgi:hypothetical protein